jgi:uncharacterized protein
VIDAPGEEGWYPDPSGRFPRRWWDGERWTSYARDTEVSWDPQPIEDAAPVEEGLPGIVSAFVGYGAAVGLAALVAVVLVQLDRPGEGVGVLVLTQLGLWTGLVGATVVVSRRRGTGSLLRDFAFRFRWIDLGYGIAGSIAGRFVAAVMVTPLPQRTRRIGDVDKSLFGTELHGRGAWLALVLVVCVGAPLVEELFFRGLLQTRLVQRLGPTIGIVVASLLFGAAHLTAWNGPWTFVYAWAVAGGGLVLGLLRYLTGRLGPSIVAHAFFNAQAVLLVALLQ